MLLSEGRILTTHAGSLPRPPELRQMYIDLSQGRVVAPEQLRAVVEQAARRAIARQLEAGIDIGNDGEQGRESFFSYVRQRMSGFSGRSERKLARDVTTYPGFAALRMAAMPEEKRVDLSHAPKAVGAISYVNRAALVEECDRFMRLADESGREQFAERFMTAPSPGIIAAAMSNEYYPSDEQYIFALAEALRTEYKHIVEQGLLLQLDCPDLALERHISFADRPLRDFLDFVDTVIAALNRALEGIPADRVRLHVCWGNYSGPHVFDVALADILPHLYAARVGALVIEAANPRHEHEYRCFKSQPLPADMCLVTGVIDTKTNYVEHPEVIADRIERVAQMVGDPRRVIAGTDCGFETAAGSGAVVDEIVWVKLRALREGADIASRRLFG
jgi:5-methyltetrahydropteroyltriglutamate--homocysteine methyltransferase